MKITIFFQLYAKKLQVWGDNFFEGFACMYFSTVFGVDACKGRVKLTFSIFFKFLSSPPFRGAADRTLWENLIDQILNQCGRSGNHSYRLADHSGIMNDHCGQSGNHSD